MYGILATTTLVASFVAAIWQGVITMRRVSHSNWIYAILGAVTLSILIYLISAMSATISSIYFLNIVVLHLYILWLARTHLPQEGRPAFA